LIVNIDKSRLSDAPYRADRKDAFTFEDNGLVDQTVLELTHGLPSSVLVSGYRGVGKTSFVNRVAEKLGDDFLCVTLILAKYEGYPALIKKLIRALYLGYEPRLAAAQEKNEEQVKFAREFKLLYDRTFHDIVHNRSYNTKKESKVGREAEFDLKKALPILLTLLTTTNLAFGVLGTKALGYLLFIFSIAWTCLSVFKISLSKNNNTTDSEEITRKSLYDDQIAEHHLLAVLSQLQTQKVNVLIVFDELDKIEKTKEVTPVINDLKFLLLSGLASFFVIAGQGLYYQYERSGDKDDRVISSLFSRSIHIPFLTYAALKAYCKALVSNEELRNDTTINDHFDELILASRRIPRKLVNLIRDQVHWKDAQAYLSFDHDPAKLEKETRLLHTLTRVMDTRLPGITSDPVQLSFYIAQIHLWIIKMKRYEEARFQMSAVIDEPAYQGKFPETYIAPLRAVADLLTDELLEDAILQIHHHDDEDVESSFSWLFGIKETPESTSGNGDDPDSPVPPASPFDPAFVVDFADVEALMRMIYLDIEPEDQRRGKYSFQQLVNRLIETGVLTKKWYSSKQVKELVDIRTKIVHGEGINQKEIKTVQNAAFTLNRLRAEIIDDFIFYIAVRYLSSFNVKREQNEFDFTARRGNTVILFDIKYEQKSQEKASIRTELMDKLKNYGFDKSLEMYYTRFVFRGNRRVLEDDIDTRAHKPASLEYKEVKDRLAFYYIHGEQQESIKAEVEDCLGITLAIMNIPLN
jgi:Cdc6-like AAA superfamily ATPase